VDFLGKEAAILYHCLTDFDQDLFDTNVKQMTLTFYRIIYLQKIGGVVERLLELRFLPQSALTVARAVKCLRIDL